MTTPAWEVRLILIVISLPSVVNVDQARPTLQSDLSTALGREVTWEICGSESCLGKRP